MGETYWELAMCVQKLASKWTWGCTSQEELLQMVKMEQILNILLKDIKVWVGS